MTSLLLDSTAVRLRALVARDQVSGRLPSLVAGVARGGGLAWWTACGSAVRPGEPGAATSDTQYRIGSITKTLTAITVMQLRDESRLDLADRIGDHLPDAPYADRTVRDLLAHDGGLPAEPPGDWWERSRGSTYEELLQRLAGEPDRFSASSRFHYSNLGYALLGRLVALARGASWWDVVSERVLGPLGMTRTSYLPVEPSAAGLSVHPFAGTLTREPAHDSLAMAPAGQVWSTLADLARYAGFWAAPDAAVLDPATVDQMTTPQIGAPTEGAAGGYGLGLRLAPTPWHSVAVGHTGSMPGFLAGLFVDRRLGIGAVCLANGGTGLRAEGLPLDLIALVNELEPTMPAPWTPVDTVPPEVADVLGVWHWGNQAVALSYDGQRVTSRLLGGGEQWDTFRLVPGRGLVGESGYHAGEALHAVRDASGDVSHLECATFIFTRTPYDPTAPIPGGAP